MKVAIIGAGLSGLSCAFELQKHGITPTVFEQCGYLGDVIDFVSVIPRMFYKPKIDPIKYFHKEYNLQLTPLSKISKISMVTAHKGVTQNGSLGYSFKRGQDSNSLENQIANKVTCPIHFDKYVELEDIQDNYDYIVVATARSETAYKLKLWQNTFTSYQRIAKIYGNFKKDCVTMWLNTKFSNNGFAYLVPENEKVATLCLIINGITYPELNVYWNNFLNILDFNHTVVRFIDTKHQCGFISTFQNDNIFFTGNSAGLTDDLIGCGSINAIESGLLAGKAIAQSLDYNLLIKPISDNIKKLHSIRNTINTFDNKRLDKLISILKFPLVKGYMYKNPYFRVTQLETVAKLYNNWEKHTDRIDKF